MEATTLRVRALVDWLDLLRNLDFDGVRNLLTALQDLKAAVTPAEKVEAALRVLRVTAQLTPMTGDDTLVAWLDKLMTPEMIAVIAKLLGLFNTVTPVEATATATCEGGCECTTENSGAVLMAADAELQAKAIPWALLLQLLPVILELIEKFRNRT
jgi:hypothetical protein